MSRTDFENKVEAKLLTLAIAEESLADGTGGRGGYCVTYKFPQVDFDTVTSQHINKPSLYRGEVLSLLRYNTTEAFNGAETFDIGEVGGAADTIVNGGTLATGLGIGATDRGVLVAGATPIIPIGALELILACTSVGTTGICDLALTIRWYL